MNLNYYYCVSSLRRMDLASLRDFVLGQGLGTNDSDDVRMCCQRFQLILFSKKW